MIPKYVVNPVKTTQDIQYMTNHVLIDQFMGIWPTKKDLIWWITTKWKPTGHLKFYLNLKGFFTIVFYNLDWVFKKKLNATRKIEKYKARSNLYNAMKETKRVVKLSS